MDFIKSRHELVIGSTEEEFVNSACAPGSVLFVPLHRPRLIMDGDAHVNITVGSVGHRVNMRIILVAGPRLLTLPYSMIVTIKAIIVAGQTWPRARKLNFW